MSPVEVAGLDGGLGSLPTDLLGKGLDEAVLQPGDAGRDESVGVWTEMVAEVAALVVRPASTREVATVVGLASDRGLALGVEAGGHDIAGTAIADGGLLGPGTDADGHRRPGRAVHRRRTGLPARGGRPRGPGDELAGPKPYAAYQ